MKKYLYNYMIILCLCSLLLCACSSSKQAKEQKSWDFVITCAEESDNSYVITYVDEKITSTTGILTIENRNDFDITVHLFKDGKERIQEMKAGGVAILYQLSKDTEYTVGCYADVSEGTEIKFMICDGRGNNL